MRETVSWLYDEIFTFEMVSLLIVDKFFCKELLNKNETIF